MKDLEKYTESELREELEKREELRKSKTQNGMYRCRCQHCGRLILSKFPTANCCDECAH